MNKTEGTCACGFVASSCDLIPCREKDCEAPNYVPRNDANNSETATGSEIDHPTHYNKGIEVIDFIESWGLDFRYGNVVKYTCRAPFKGSRLNDLLKAKWYLERLIKEEERKEKNAQEAAGRLGDYINALNRRVQ